MKKYPRIIALALALLMCVGLFAGCGSKKDPGKDWKYVQDAGKMVIGITDYEPMNYYDDDGTLIGFDTELAQAVCDYLGIDAEFIEIDWDYKETELNAYNIDCIWNGFTYTEERDQNLDFSEHYLYNQIVTVIRREDAAKYATVADLANAKICAEGGSSGESCISADPDLSKAQYTPWTAWSTP
jgi:polar amino acid transport system substrate-binding protein